MHKLEMQRADRGKVQIAENVWQVGGSGQTASEVAGIYLIRFGDAAALMDAGCGGGTGKLFANIGTASHTRREPRVVRYTPEDTRVTPTNSETLSGSSRIRKAKSTALTGTKLMKSPARTGPMRFIPS